MSLAGQAICVDLMPLARWRQHNARPPPALPRHAHDVVVLYHHLTVVIAHSGERSAVLHQRFRQMRGPEERTGRIRPWSLEARLLHVGPRGRGAFSWAQAIE